MAVAGLRLVDMSVWARVRKPPVAARLEKLLRDGLVATCAVVDLELLRSANNREEVEQLTLSRAGLAWLSTPDEVWDRVLEVQSALSAQGRRTAVKIPDLLVAAVAERHRATVLHYDRDFDTIAEITGQPTEWVVPAGSVS